MSQLISEIQIRNRHLVYQEGENYKVIQIKKGKELNQYSYLISNTVVNYLFDNTRGITVDTKKAFKILEYAKSELKLDEVYGYKLSYYAQEVLIVLVALNKAFCYKEGKKYYYKIY